MNEIRDALGPLLTTQGFGFILVIAGTTIGALISTSSRSGDGSVPATEGEGIALALCLGMIAVGLACLTLP